VFALGVNLLGFWIERLQQVSERRAFGCLCEERVYSTLVPVAKEFNQKLDIPAKRRIGSIS
jgi:hypothetical protein